MRPEKHLLKRFCGIALIGIMIGILNGAPVAVQGQASAQKPPGAPYTIPVHVNRVLIPTVVRDKHGHLIDGLQQQDFTVLDDGKPREITGFQVEKTQAAEGTRAQSAMPPSGNAAAPATRAQALGPRFIVLLFDDLHLTSRSLAAAKKGAADLLANMPLNTDYVAVASLSGNTNSGLTHDRALLQKTLNKLRLRNQIRVGNSSCPKMDYYQAYLIDERHDQAALEDAESQIRACTENPIPVAVDEQAQAMARNVMMHGHMDAQNTFSRIERFANAMAPLPGQRLLILASPGFFMDTPEDLSRESQAIDAAAKGDVIISTLDARGLYTTNVGADEDDLGRLPQEMAQMKTRSMFESEGVMVDLANGTGGSYFYGNNGLGGGFERLTVAPASLYLLEISLDGVKRDGSFHRLEVKVDRSGAKVQARLGYPAPNRKTPKEKKR